ncbi:MAG: alkaline phosphatase family protein [Anaerolineaceae bacterium]
MYAEKISQRPVSMKDKIEASGNTMIKKYWIYIGMIALLLIAGGGYFGATAIMDSLFEYRSPLAENPPSPAAAGGEALTRRVVIVLVDALREDTALDPEVMPYLNELRQNAAVATMHSQAPSYSAPGWNTILTGAWPDINDSQPANPPDDDSVRTFTQDDIFAAADRAGLKTAVSGFTWFEQMLANSGVDNGFYTPGEDNAADEDVLEAAIPWLESGEYDLVLIHLDQVDYAGHYEGGAASESWKAAAGRVDAMLQTITAALDLEQDTLFVFSDHGQIDRGGHGGHDPITLVEPFVMIGAGVKPGQYADIEMVDIASTVAALLGTSIPASNQGRGLTEMLTLSVEQETVFSEVLLTQQDQLLRDYQVVMGANVTAEKTTNSTASAMESMHAQRLNKERLPRLVIAVVLALIPAILLYRKRNRNLGKLFSGAAVSVLVFNLIYAVIMGKSYSLSSLTSATDFIFSTAIYMGISFLIAWCVSMFSLKGLSNTPSSAAQNSLNFTLITLYLLALSILWNFYRNGALITWTLPEFSSMFLGFLAILQSMFVAIFGLLLIGISALVASFRTRALRK